MKSINLRLKHICYIKDLKHKQVAKDLNINVQQFNNWCNNTKPTIEVLEAITGYFPDLNPRWFMTGKGEPFPSEKNNTFHLDSDYKHHKVNYVVSELDFYIKKLKKSEKEYAQKTKILCCKLQKANEKNQLSVVKVTSSQISQ
jgi:transcriptional regulator with XRE-family HTH domain